MRTEYRSEYVYGNGIRNPKQVLMYEIFELGNSDIPHYICTNYTISSYCKSKWLGYIEELEMNGFVDDFSTKDKEEAVSELLNNLMEATNKKINYVLWLASKEDVISLYHAEKEDIEQYPIGEVILSDLGHDGRLYGYSENPIPISK